ncbi:hypothetical protein K466DRAFT_589602 [Polyporus arcularius HHB13444]|uniref:Uncharacterized protein n=1 Tax=Polyporus arcularius HHB13444 TaxID=1314778 RepID=A0A5C3P3N8_9APHY|nr:hypothetical protein K466DRAFT_589602 [Polyporus arcularius HHB13444]
MDASCDADLKEPVIVFARWAGYLGGRPRGADEWKNKAHVYSTSMLPEQPLEIGMKVRVMGTAPAWYSRPDEEPETYDAYDAHIVGRITRAVGWKGRKIVLEVRNECALNGVAKARIRVPFVPEAAVRIGTECLPEGGREAFEGDLNTEAVVKASQDELKCMAGRCWAPWRALVGEGFLEEPMGLNEEVCDRTGATGGRRKVQTLLVGWSEVAEA